MTEPTGPELPSLDQLLATFDLDEAAYNAILAHPTFVQEVEAFFKRIGPELAGLFVRVYPVIGPYLKAGVTFGAAALAGAVGTVAGPAAIPVDLAATAGGNLMLELAYRYALKKAAEKGPSP